jgi:hypothetical protein
MSGPGRNRPSEDPVVKVSIATGFRLSGQLKLPENDASLVRQVCANWIERLRLQSSDFSEKCGEFQLMSQKRYISNHYGNDRRENIFIPVSQKFIRHIASCMPSSSVDHRQTHKNLKSVGLEASICFQRVIQNFFCCHGKVTPRAF